MNTGDTLRFIRTSKDFKQKEMLPDHQDSSTYSRIENGQRNMKLNDLISVLKQLDISIVEFFNFVSHDKKQEKFLHYYYYCGSHPNNKSSKLKLIEIYNEIDKKNNKTITELSNYIAIKLLFYDRWEEIDPITDDEIEMVYNHLNSAKYYFLNEYKLLSNIVTFLNNRQVEKLLRKAYPIKDETKRDYTTKKFAFNVFINLISVKLYNREYELARKYIKMAKQLDKQTTNYSYVMNIKYLENLTDYLTKGEPEYMQQINNFIHILEDIGDTIHAEDIKKEVKLLTHNQDKGIDIRYGTSLIKE